MIRRRALKVRLGEGFAKPWNTQVVIPETSVATQVTPVPLPTDAIVLAINERTAGVQGQEGSGSQPVTSETDVLLRLPPERAFAFYKEAMGTSTRIVSETPERLVLAPGSRRPSWLPSRTKHLNMSIEPYLFEMSDGVAIFDSRYARFTSPAGSGGLEQPRTIRNLPTDVHRYWIILHLEPEAAKS